MGPHGVRFDHVVRYLMCDPNPILKSYRAAEPDESPCDYVLILPDLEDMISSPDPRTNRSPRTLPSFAILE